MNSVYLVQYMPAVDNQVLYQSLLVYVPFGTRDTRSILDKTQFSHVTFRVSKFLPTVQTTVYF
jgi:hypothetical protein